MKMSNKILIPAVIILAVVCLTGAYAVINSANAGSTVYVYKDGKLVKTLELSEEPYTVDLGTNTLYVESDGVSVTSADCPDKLCMKQGKIKNSSRSIVCLPNRIVIEIDGKKGEVDAVAGR